MHYNTTQQRINTTTMTLTGGHIMKHLLIAAITCSLLFALTMQTQAQELTAQEILEKTDEVSMAAQDQHSFSTMTLVDKDGDEKVRKSEIFERNSEDMRLVRFLSPADQKGISFLSLPDDKMYIYMPAFKKIRTIASHVKNENFAGTDFSYDDMSSASRSEDYDPELLEITDEHYVLKLVPKPDSEKEYGYLKSWIRKDIFFSVKTEHYDKGGNLWKVMTRSNIEQIKGYWFALEMEMHDVKKDHRTKNVTDEIEVDTGLDDKIFTQRNLKRTR
jgi:outer membrane lipoprotein-sorting protein